MLFSSTEEKKNHATEETTETTESEIDKTISIENVYISILYFDLKKQPSARVSLARVLTAHFSI